MKRSALLKKLSGDSLIYGLSSVLVKFIGLFLFPFFARKLSPEDYGIINIFNTLTFFTNAVIVLGLDAAATRWFYDKEDKEYRNQLFSNWWFAHSSMAFMAVLVIALVGQVYFLDAFVPVTNNREIMLLVCFNILLQVPPLITNSFFVLNKKPTQAAIFSVLSSLIAAICSLYFVFRLELGVLGFYLGQTVSFFAYSLFGFVLYLRKVISFRLINFKVLREMVQYGIHVIPANVSAQMLLFVSALIIQHFLSHRDLGFYQIGTTLASGILLITWPFALAFQPLSFSIMNEPFADDFYAFILNLYTLVVATVCLSLALFFPEIIQLLLTNKYTNSAFVSGLLTFANFIYSLNIIAAIGMSKVKKIKYFGRVVSISNLLTIALIYFLTYQFGLNGAAIGLLIGQVLAIAGLFYYSQKSYYIPFNLAKSLLIIVLALGLFVSHKVLLSEYSNQFLIRLLLIATFAIISLSAFPGIVLRIKRIKSYLRLS